MILVWPSTCLIYKPTSLLAGHLPGPWMHFSLQPLLYNTPANVWPLFAHPDDRELVPYQGSAFHYGAVLVGKFFLKLTWNLRVSDCDTWMRLGRFPSQKSSAFLSPEAPVITHSLGLSLLGSIVSTSHAEFIKYSPERMYFQAIVSSGIF